MATILRPSLDRWVRGQQGQRYRDDFASLSGRWVAQAGSLAVSGGALQAATRGDWGPNVCTNPEITSDLTGYAGSGAAPSRVDSETDPGVSSVTAGADDKWVLKVTRTVTTGAYRYAYWGFPAPIGAVYRLRALGYAPTQAGSTETGGLYGNSTWWSSPWNAPISAWDAWEELSALRTTIADNVALGFLAGGFADEATGLYVVYDDVEIYRQNALALLAGWRSPNHVATLHHVSPATAVTPFGYICHYTDALNYWEVRVLPNTAGNDLQIIQVTAGVETTRAEADVDWTTDDTDELMVDCRGATIATYHRKSGAAVWTAGPSYASATQGQTSPNVGVMLYETGVGRLSGFEIRAL